MRNFKLKKIFFFFFIFFFTLPFFNRAIADKNSEQAFIQVDSSPISQSWDDVPDPYKVNKIATVNLTISHLPFVDDGETYYYHLYIGDKDEGDDADYGRIEIKIKNGECTIAFKHDDDKQRESIWNKDATSCDPITPSSTEVVFHTQIYMNILTDLPEDQLPKQDHTFAIAVKAYNDEPYWKNARFYLQFTDEEPVNTLVTVTTDAITAADSTYQINSGDPIVITANGCNAGLVNFDWKETSFGDRNDSKHDVPTVNDANGNPVATFTKGGCTENETCDKQAFTADKEHYLNTFNIKATCADGRQGNTTLYIIRTGEGEEEIYVSPPIPQRTQPFNIVMLGLGSNVCYYVQIKNTETNEYIKGPGTGDGGCSSILNDPNVFAASDQWYKNTETKLEVSPQPIGSYRVYLRINKNVDGVVSDNDKNAAKKPFNVQEYSGTPTPFPPPCEQMYQAVDSNGKAIDDPKNGSCLKFQSALGSFSTSSKDFINSVLTFLLSISGGIVIILIIRAGYIMLTSRGDPEKIESAKEILTSAIVGLLFIIFSLVILQVITVDLLKIPGFRP